VLSAQIAIEKRDELQQLDLERGEERGEEEKRARVAL
jgi:hypothetical protein